MPPKKQGKNQQQDDWEAELGESITPADGTTSPANGEENADAKDGDDADDGGGLLAALKKNRSRKAKKGKGDDFVEGEDPTAADTADAAGQDPKQPEEGTFDDEDDVFAGNAMQGKAVAAAAADKKKQQQDENEDTGGKMKSKKEKEKERKEKEKQRKKEQVRTFQFPFLPLLVYGFSLCCMGVSISNQFYLTIGRRQKEDNWSGSA